MADYSSVVPINYTFNTRSEPVVPSHFEDDYVSQHEVDETEELIERGVLYRCHYCGNIWDGNSQCTCNL